MPEETAAATPEMTAERLIADDASTARSSVVVAATQLLASLLGGAFALLVAVLVGEGPKTDGFLAAYSAYLMFIMLGTTLRVSMVPQLGPTSDPQAFKAIARRRIRQIVPVAIVASAVFILAAPLLSYLLLHDAGPVARDAATISIAILGAAALCQTWAALLSAVLAGGRRFVASSGLYLLNSAVMIAAGAALMPAYGATGAAIGVLIAATTLAVGHLIYLARLHFTAWPRPADLLDRESWAITGRVASGSSLTVALQLNLTVSISMIAGQTGNVTAYVYAYMSTLLLAGVTAGPLGFVTLPNLIEALDRHGEKAIRDYLVDTCAFAMFLFVPLAVGYVSFGRPVVDAVLGNTLSPATLDLFWDASRIFLIMGTAWVMFTPVITLAITQKRYARLGAISMIFVGVNAALVIPLSQVSALAVAAGQAASGVLLMLGLLFGLVHDQPARTGLRMAAKSLPCVPLSMIFVVPALLSDDVNSLGAAIVALTACSAVYALAGTRLWPSVGGVMLKLMFSRGPAGGAGEPSGSSVDR